MASRSPAPFSFAFPGLLAIALPAQAFTFTEPAHFSYSGNVNFLSPPTVVDTDLGFVLRGDYQLGAGTSFLIASRLFQIGPLPERIESFADENFKIVLAGGGSGAASMSRFAAGVFYGVQPVPQGNVLPTPVTYGALEVFDNGLAFRSEFRPFGFDASLPTNGILGPGTYRMQAFIVLELSVDPQAPYPQSGVIELGGLSPFAGVQLSALGTPVPEPGPAALLAAGLAALAWRRARLRKVPRS